MAKSKIIKSNILAEEITYFFEENKGGLYSDSAWYELLDYCYKYVTGKCKDTQLISYLEFVFGFEGRKEFIVVLNRTRKRVIKVEKELYGSGSTPKRKD